MGKFATKQTTQRGGHSVSMSPDAKKQSHPRAGAAVKAANAPTDIVTKPKMAIGKHKTKQTARCSRGGHSSVTLTDRPPAEDGKSKYAHGSREYRVEHGWRK